MRNKSLTRRSCDLLVLCGINVRFQTVSPTQGQVAHALLTRPPLIRGRSPVTVRLECVMHAASVHPEPGSNSRANCILTALAVEILCRACLALFTCLSMSPSRDRIEISFKEIRDSFALAFACTLISCCSIVNDPRQISLPLRVLRDSIIIPHLFPFVKRFLKSFLKNFRIFQKPFNCSFQAGGEVPDYYITSSCVCQEVFQKFFQLFSRFFFGAVFRSRSWRPLVDSPAARQLAYYSTFVSICQAFFDKFFQFGAVVSLS